VVKAGDQIDFYRTQLEEGDSSWLDEIYIENKDQFLAWGTKKYGFEKDDLMDIYHNAVLIFYENIFYNRLKSLESSVATYLFGTGKNLILKHYRNDKKIEKHESRLQEHWSFVHMSDIDLEKVYETVKDLLRKTSDPCRSIIRMFYLKGMSISDIATELDYKNPDVVKTQKSRCFKAFKEKVKSLIK